MTQQRLKLTVFVTFLHFLLVKSGHRYFITLLSSLRGKVLCLSSKNVAFISHRIGKKIRCLLFLIPNCCLGLYHSTHLVVCNRHF